MSHDAHQTFYTHAELYEKAFGWRDIEAECAFMTEVSSRRAGRSPGAMLELGCGPAEHARWYAAHGVHAHALDLSRPMLDYAESRAQPSDLLHTHCADMCDFTLDNAPVDLACCLMDSVAYMTTHEAFRAHLDCVARALAPGGVYIIETMHPKDALSQVPTTKTSWSVEDHGQTIDVMFGHPDNELDPLTQVTMTDVTWRVRRDEEVLLEMTERAPLKLYLYQELLALIHGSALRVVDTFGSLDTQVPFGSGPKAWRMVLVLQKKDAL